jgi:hypothetical protein
VVYNIEHIPTEAVIGGQSPARGKLFILQEDGKHIIPAG